MEANPAVKMTELYMILQAVTAEAAEAAVEPPELKSISIPPAGAVTVPQQELVVQAAAGAVGTRPAPQQKHVRNPASRQQEQHARADIKQEP